MKEGQSCFERLFYECLRFRGRRYGYSGCRDEVSQIRTHDEKDLYQLEAEIFRRKILGENVELIPLSDTLRNLDTLELLLKQ